MSQLTVVLAVVTASAFLVAARYWSKSSQVNAGEALASVSDDLDAHILAAQNAIIQSAHFSQIAAQWAASAAVLGAATAICRVL